MIPQIIKDICEYLRNCNVQLSNNFTDGRLNSMEDESKILNLINKKFDIIIPRDREWYDFAIEDNNDFYPINIKITDTTHNDNLSCKLGIYYALTGLIPDFANEVSWKTFFEKLHGNIGKSKNKDYYFLIVNKLNLSNIFCNSLKGLQHLIPNGNNLPFQCRWSENRNCTYRDFDQSTYFILKTFGDSIKLRSQMYFDFKKYFPNYV